MLKNFFKKRFEKTNVDNDGILMQFENKSASHSLQIMFRKI